MLLSLCCEVSVMQKEGYGKNMQHGAYLGERMSACTEGLGGSCLALSGGHLTFARLNTSKFIRKCPALQTTWGIH